MYTIYFILLLCFPLFANFEGMNMSHRPFITHPRKVKCSYHTNTWSGGSNEAHPSVHHNKHKQRPMSAAPRFFLRSLHRTKLIIWRKKVHQHIDLYRPSQVTINTYSGNKSHPQCCRQWIQVMFTSFTSFRLLLYHYILLFIVRGKVCVRGKINSS